MAVSSDAVRDDGLPVVRELGPYVSIAEAMRLTGYSAENIRRLVKRRRVQGAAWDERTVLVHRRSLLSYVGRRGAGGSGGESELTVVQPAADM